MTFTKHLPPSKDTLRFCVERDFGERDDANAGDARMRNAEGAVAAVKSIRRVLLLFGRLGLKVFKYAEILGKRLGFYFGLRESHPSVKRKT